MNELAYVDPSDEGRAWSAVYDRCLVLRKLLATYPEAEGYRDELEDLQVMLSASFAGEYGLAASALDLGTDEPLVDADPD